MSEQESLTRAQQFVDELNKGELDSVQQYMARDFFAYIPADDEQTQAEVYHDVAAGLWSAFPDMQVTVQDLHFEDDLLKGQMTFNGTHNGSLWGAPATGNEITWTADFFLRPIEDRFALSVENVAVPDVIGLLRQAGLAPPADKMDQPFNSPAVIPEIVAKTLFTGQVADKACSHLDDIQMTEPKTDVCEDCVAQGDVWPALRMCLICGYVGCCDTSKNKHMKQHYEQTGHPIFRSIRLDESWVWCYEDDAYFYGRTLDKYR